MPAIGAFPAVRRAFALRMSLFFAAFFLVNGVVVPFFPVWLQARGLSDVEIANCVAFPALFRVLLMPLVGFYADRAPNHRFAVITIMLPAAVIFLFAWPLTGFWPLLLTTGTALTLAALGGPPGLAVALTGVRRLGVDFGRMRMAGTVSFGVANLGAGAILGFFPAEAAFWLILLALALAAAGSFALPEASTEPAGSAKEEQGGPPAKREERPLRALLANRALLAMMAGSGLTMASHAMLNSFGSIAWHRLGFSSFQIGSLWAMGLVAEASVLLWSGRILRVVGPRGLLVVGAAAAIVRWSLFPLEPGFLGSMVLQSFHGLTFGCNTLGIQHLIARAVPERTTASAQGFYAMFVGILLAATTALAGPLYAGFGIAGFLAMVPVAGVGLTLFLVFRNAVEA